jgi:hypothetical protein
LLRNRQHMNPTNLMHRKNRHINPGVVISIAVCGVLFFIGVVRLLSYSLGATGDFVRHSPFAVLCYNPASLANVQYFKILATPSVVALIYFFFRWRNAGAPEYLGSVRFDRVHRLDFESPLLRGILTTVITVHWLGMEWWKFHVEGFYPWSALENPLLNAGILLLGQGLAFWGMKYLSFEPISKQERRR